MPAAKPPTHQQPVAPPLPAAAAQPASGGPHRHLGVRHAMAVCVGMVIGAGIFKTSPMVAASLGSDLALYAAWALGGLLSFIGALCYAEMAAAFPDAGGDYHFLRRAFGLRFGFLFAWSRFAVIHTGSVALLAYVFGDYLAQVLPLTALLGEAAGPVYAAAIVLLLTLLNLAGVSVGMRTQLGLTLLVLLGLLAVGAAGGWLQAQGQPPATPLAVADPLRRDWGTALIFVFLAYGGWSDAATLSTEMRDERRGIARALLAGLLLITALYLLANWAYLQGLGLDGLARSAAPAADLARLAFGPAGAWAMVFIVTLTAISTINAILIAGARTTYAAVRDLGQAAPQLAALGRWHPQRGIPSRAVLAMGAVSLALVALGAFTRSGFATLVDYLSPVYWAFLAASGLALVVLRRRFPLQPRPFRVPLYPLLPLLFCACSLGLLWASLAYVKLGAIVGLGVLALGAVLLWPLTRADRPLR